MADTYLLSYLTDTQFSIAKYINLTGFNDKNDFEVHFYSIIKKWSSINPKTIKDNERVKIATAISESNYQIIKSERYIAHWILKNNEIAQLNMAEGSSRFYRSAASSLSNNFNDPPSIVNTETNESVNKKKAASSRKRKIIDENVSTIEDISAINGAYDQSLFDEEPTFYNTEVYKNQITVTKNKKIYQFHAPSTSIISPNKLALQKEDIQSLEAIFDIVMSCNRSKCNESYLTIIYDQYKSEEKRNSCITNVEFATDLLKHTILSNTKFDEVTIWSYESSSKFIIMMKRILADFCLSCDRAIPLDCNDERTFAAESIVTWFRSFGVLTNLTFTWFEKQNDNNKSSWLPLSDFRQKECKTKLLDGLGLSLNKKVAIFIESSG